MSKEIKHENQNYSSINSLACFLTASDSIGQQTELSDAEVTHAAATANQIDIDFLSWMSMSLCLTKTN